MSHSAPPHTVDSPAPAPAIAPAPAAPPRPRPPLAELARWSLLLGATGFGGGLSVLAAIRAHAVAKRGWLTDREFTNTATVAQMLPVSVRTHGWLTERQFADAVAVGKLTPG